MPPLRGSGAGGGGLGPYGTELRLWRACRPWGVDLAGEWGCATRWELNGARGGAWRGRVVAAPPAAGHAVPPAIRCNPGGVGCWGRGGGDFRFERAEHGVQSTKYRVQSTEYRVERGGGEKAGVRGVCRPFGAQGGGGVGSRPLRDRACRP